MICPFYLRGPLACVLDPPRGKFENVYLVNCYLVYLRDCKRITTPFCLVISPLLFVKKNRAIAIAMLRFFASIKTKIPMSNSKHLFFYSPLVPLRALSDIRQTRN